MTIRVFAQDTVSHSEIGVFVSTGGSVTQRKINLRDVLDTGGPHMITFGLRCVVADPAAFNCNMVCQYETPNGQLRAIGIVAPVDLTVITEASGAMWYASQQLTIDKRYPLANGPGVDPYGTFHILFTADAPGTSKLSYECIVETFDGSGSVITYP